MSPIPSPTPLRRRLAQILFSPAGLLFGFIAIVIVACPGARSSEPGLITATTKAVLAGNSHAARFILMAPTPANLKPRVVGRSTRFDGVTPSTDPSPEVTGQVDALRHSKSILPLLVDPLLTDTPQASAATIRPMTGRPVGIRSGWPPTTP